MLRCVFAEGRRRLETEGEGEVDMRSLSEGSSDAFRFRPDMVEVLKGSENG